MTTAELLTQHGVSEIDTLGYDPTTAALLALIQASAVALYPEELDALAARSFVISAR